MVNYIRIDRIEYGPGAFPQHSVAGYIGEVVWVEYTYRPEECFAGLEAYRLKRYDNPGPLEAYELHDYIHDKIERDLLANQPPIVEVAYWTKTNGQGVTLLYIQLSHPVL